MFANKERSVKVMENFNQENQTQENTVQSSNRPVGQLRTNRGLLKYILLSLITFGIYGIVAMSSLTNDINVIASRYDGKKTMHYCLLSFLVAPITCGIAVFVWYHKMSNRIGSELARRNIDFKFSATDFWLWNILGALIIVGPFIYTHKLFKAMNLISENYNING
ncbi:MAG: DUF4234 domain-containing protein [Clostridia bacterium]|nr:DUF4234 domain-containing protein [Clostridia bacterium]